MSKKAIFYSVFFVALAAIFYFSLKAAIPDFGKKRVPPISRVQAFSFTNQDGQTVTKEAIKGKVALVNFFFTTCTSVCPRMNNNLKPAYDAFKNNPQVVMLSFTSDPQRDSAAVLKRYADSMQVNTAKWMFLTGKKDSLYRAARHSFKLDDPSNFVESDAVDFLHTQFIALVNKKGEVVKIYDGLKPSELKSIESDINILLKD
ncbi:MAG TPA: SCO family protein [Flavisolibacter sp.]|jgi:protein SCO1/2